LSNLGLDTFNLGLHVVNGVGSSCVFKEDFFFVKGGPNPGPRHILFRSRDNVVTVRRATLFVTPTHQLDG
jgi:hypothetical protein